MRIRRGGALLIGVLLLSGCGAAQQRATDQHPPTPQRTPTSDGDGSRVPPLPDLSSFPTPSVTPRAGSGPSATPGRDRRLLGADVSWPQCPKGMGIPQKRSEGLPMPSAAARFVVIGLTNGPSFVANPCLQSQVDWVRERHLLGAAYAVVSYPDARTLGQLGSSGPFGSASRLDRLRNTGYQAAQFNIASMKRTGLRTPTVWVDVESVPHFSWSSDTTANAAVVQGTVRGYDDAGFTVGVYSTPALWRGVVGDLRLGVPEWRAAGQTAIDEALRRCRSDWSIQGGEAVLGQWVQDSSDRNVSCPGAMGDPARWFHQY